MSFYASFFAATDNEFAADFPHRHSVAKERRECEVVNPFTQQVQRVHEWQPIAPVPAPPKGTEFPTPEELAALERSPNCSIKNISPVELSSLQEALDVASYDEAFDELMRCELVTPGADDSLYVLPSALVKALAHADLAEIAERWRESDEMAEYPQEDTEAVLSELQQLAQTATGTGRKVYYWVYGV